MKRRTVMDVIELANKALTDLLGTDTDGLDSGDPMERLLIKYATDYAEHRLEVADIARRIAREFTEIAEADLDITPRQSSDLNQRYIQERSKLDGAASSLRSVVNAYKQSTDN